jgi:hypothetical protein
LPSDLIAASFAERKTPPEWRGFLCDQMNADLPVAVMMAPVAMVPVPVMPAMMMPTVVVPVMVMPANLYRPDLIDFVLRYDCRLNVRRCRDGRCLGRDRRYGCSLRACAKQDRARDQSSAEIQKISEFHEVKLLS